jgi:hypothetical protein
MELELIGPLATIRKIIKLLADPDYLAIDLLSLADELAGRLVDEADSKVFWALNVRESDLYRNHRKGREQVIERFPGVLTDIEEASKCFALCRYAAAVFHSLQVIEAGVIELGRLLVVKDPLPGWSATINRLEAILARKYPERTQFQQRHSATLEQIDATAGMLMSAWRNKISHVQGRLVLMTSEFAPRDYRGNPGGVPWFYAAPRDRDARFHGPRFVMPFGGMTSRSTASNPSSISSAPVCRAVSRNRSN